jgi:hypothetical protein
MDYEPIILEGFDGREDELLKIERFRADLTPVMLYRSNDLIHSRRVLEHLDEALLRIVDVYGDDFNVKYARTLALVHDDLEIITGDVQLNDKETMSDAGKAKLKEQEYEGVVELTSRYSEVANGISYGDLLRSTIEKDSLEAQMVSFFDKFDAAGEAWHECFAGNLYFAIVASGRNKIDGGYIKRMRKFPHKYPMTIPFFQKNPEYLPVSVDINKIVAEGEPHWNVITHDTGHFLYEKWKRNIRDIEGDGNLLNQKEFLQPNPASSK